jgi:hypothetical protein
MNGPWRLGQPISNEQVEQVNGVPTRVQYFERGRLEWREASQSVGFSPLGVQARAITCQQAQAK